MKNQLKTIRVIHFAIMTGPIFFYVVVLLRTLKAEEAPLGIEVLNYLSPALFFIALAIHPILFKSAIKNVKGEQTELKKKMMAYQTGHIMRMAILEGAALFAGIVALLNSELYHFITIAIVLGIMFTKIPTPLLIETELEITTEEKEALQ